MKKNQQNTLIDLKDKTIQYPIIIYGAGAIGASFGGWLSLYYNNIYILARGDNAKILKSDGLVLYQKDKKKTDPIPLKIIEDINEKNDPLIVIIAVKNYNLEDAAREISSKLGDKTIIVALQNGIENQNILPKYFSKVIYGIVSYNAWIDKYGIIGYKEKGEIILGTLNKELDEITENISGYLNQAFPVRYTNKLQDAIHTKMIINLGNSVMTLFNYKDLKVDSISILKKIFIGVMKEGMQIIKASGYKEQKLKAMPSWKLINLVDLMPEKISNLFFKMNIDKIGPNSMTQDVLLHNRNKTELEFLNGYFVKLALKIGIKAPYNNAIYNICKEQFAKSGFKPFDAAEFWKNNKASFL